jgi:hypothetical protein
MEAGESFRSKCARLNGGRYMSNGKEGRGGVATTNGAGQSAWTTAVMESDAEE